MSFNPCCAGCSSGRKTISRAGTMAGYLSILVVLDVVLEDNDMSLAVIGVKTLLSILVVLDVVLEVYYKRNYK